MNPILVALNSELASYYLGWLCVGGCGCVWVGVGVCGGVIPVHTVPVPYALHLCYMDVISGQVVAS